MLLPYMIRRFLCVSDNLKGYSRWIVRNAISFESKAVIDRLRPNHAETDSAGHLSFGIQIRARAEIWFEISAPLAPPIQLSYCMMSKPTPTAHCQREDDTVRERTGYPPSYAEAKKMKSLTLHNHGCLRASLRD